MGYPVRQSQTARPLLFKLYLSGTTTAATGKSPTVTLSKNGGAFASPTGSVTEVANGWYKVAGNATDTGTLGPLVLFATSAACDPCDEVYEVVSYDPENASTLGLANLSQRVTKNAALAAFPFFMVSSSDHVSGATGLTVTATRSLDGAAFAACANSVSEVGNGWYSINLAAADLNGTTVALRFAATGADTRNATIVTQPT